MRPRSAIKVHRLLARNRHIERAHRPLTRNEGDVPAVHSARHRLLQRLARHAGRALRDRVVARAELELDDVADAGGDEVGDEGVLGPADDDGNDPWGAEDAAGDWWVGIR